ncbi:MULTISPECIES: helix-turn-helix domain-containing protein [Apibacter]|uniref:helix-turn-helix domain-containing protein n=1 Tax=Apibacter TaxID=1778601 RepID=UPI000CF87675|nr:MULTISPECIES: helix-turn-helix transcriptional regulator [Apibacter]MCX8677063.1 helix-turn-helix transcriptional regulator [Apibacter sp. B3919]MXO24556.1 helix-turn-helix domain-containing protein [Apibacter sp. B3924]MXO25800.1 helix-turn-helix domain-containing protein [Apibacter sp. B3813]MXO27751.1 helix-turn-helix domain-containing protein [Apibacter sp. B3913]MXO29889.1 helix-turn-helix domain-containing protein [Apibacter sp. B3912]
MKLDIAPQKTHHGRNIKRLREMLGIKQEAIAIDLDITQQSVSELEQKEFIDDSTLKKVAKTLNVPIDAIKNMNDEATFNYINTFNDKVESSFLNNPINCTFNPIDKIVELYNEKEALYERMLKEKDELLEKLLNK